jgi:hypothetical protein
MLSYMLLAQHHQKEIPDIVYAYDGAEKLEKAESNLNTYSQVQRAQSFFTQLGYEKNIRVLKGEELKLYRDSPRRKAFKPLLAQEQYTHLIDQKLLTTFLVNHFIEFGKQETADIIRGQLIKQLLEVSLKEHFLTKLEEQVSKDIKEMRKKADPKKPLLILHARYSAKSKTQQNIDEGVLVKLEDYLTQKGYFVWYLFTDGRVNHSSFKSVKENRIDVFPFNVEGQDFGKLRHISLLLELYQQRDELNLKGIIGNTSGTLDIAALMGHRVLNLHKFSEDKFFADDVRLILQSTFMTLESIVYENVRNALRNAKGIIGPFTDEVVKEQLPRLDSWLANTSNDSLPHALPSVDDYKDKVKLGELFCVQKLTATGDAINIELASSPEVIRYFPKETKKKDKELKDLRRNLTQSFSQAV